MPPISCLPPRGRRGSWRPSVYATGAFWRNLHRRHLDESQRAMVATRVATLQRGDNQYASSEATSQRDAAEILNVSRTSVQRARQVLDDGAPELVAAVERGEVADLLPGGVVGDGMADGGRESGIAGQKGGQAQAAVNVVARGRGAARYGERKRLPGGRDAPPG